MKVCSYCGRPIRWEDGDVMEQSTLTVNGFTMYFTPGNDPMHKECLLQMMRDAIIVDKTGDDIVHGESEQSDTAD